MMPELATTQYAQNRRWSARRFAALLGAGAIALMLALVFLERYILADQTDDLRHIDWYDGYALALLMTGGMILWAFLRLGGLDSSFGGAVANFVLALAFLLRAGHVTGANPTSAWYILFALLCTVSMAYHLLRFAQVRLWITLAIAGALAVVIGAGLVFGLGVAHATFIHALRSALPL